MKRGLKGYERRWNYTVILLDSMKRGLKGISEIRSLDYNILTQWKEDWKINANSTPIMNNPTNSMKRGLKDDTVYGNSTIDHDSMKRGLKALFHYLNPIFKLRPQWKEDWKAVKAFFSSFFFLSLSMKRGLKVSSWFSSINISTFVSMKRGLKAGWQPATLFWPVIPLNEKRIERYFHNPTQLLHTPYLNEKRIESKGTDLFAKAMSIVPQWKEDWKPKTLAKKMRYHKDSMKRGLKVFYVQIPISKRFNPQWKEDWKEYVLKK